MAKNGYKIFDSDTHVGPYVDVLDKHMTTAEKSKLPAWEQYRSQSGSGHTVYNKGQRHYRRRLGKGAPEDLGPHRRFFYSPLVLGDPRPWWPGLTRAVIPS